MGSRGGSRRPNRAFLHADIEQDARLELRSGDDGALWIKVDSLDHHVLVRLWGRVALALDDAPVRASDARPAQREAPAEPTDPK